MSIITKWFFTHPQRDKAISETWVLKGQTTLDAAKPVGTAILKARAGLMAEEVLFEYGYVSDDTAFRDFRYYDNLPVFTVNGKRSHNADMAGFAPAPPQVSLIVRSRNQASTYHSTRYFSGLPGAMFRTDGGLHVVQTAVAAFVPAWTAWGAAIGLTGNDADAKLGFQTHDHDQAKHKIFSVEWALDAAAPSGGSCTITLTDNHDYEFEDRIRIASTEGTGVQINGVRRVLALAGLDAFKIDVPSPGFHWRTGGHCKRVMDIDIPIVNQFYETSEYFNHKRGLGFKRTAGRARKHAKDFI